MIITASPTGLFTLAGHWSGTDRLWFTPDDLANEGAATAVIRPTLGGNGVISEYRWVMGDDEHHGVLLIVPVDGGHQLALADTFHTDGSIMSLQPSPEPDPAALADALGSYEGDGETWGWRVAVAHPEHDRIEITMWNISPAGDATRSVSTRLTRDVDPAEDVSL